MTDGGVAGAAAGAAVKKALATRESAKALLGDVARDDPAMIRAGSLYARRVELHETALTKIFEKLYAVLHLREDYFREDFARELAEKTAAVDPADLKDPQPSVAFPAMQGLGFSLSEPELKEMYLNLLANASVTQTASIAHPAFADIIKQLSVAEVLMLEEVLGREQQGVLQIRTRSTYYIGAFDTQIRCVLGVRHPETWEYPPAKDVSIWVDNWERLGLVSTVFNIEVVDDATDPYAWREEHPEVRGIPCDDGVLSRANAPEPYLAKGALSVRDFGRRFLAAVSPLGSLRTSA